MSLQNAKRVVIKIGSALLCDPATGTLRSGWLDSLAQDIELLNREKIDVVLVTSGAVALGRHLINPDAEGIQLDEKQAAAACGQVLLMQAYQQVLGVHGIKVGQILMTIEDSDNRRRYLNARNTLRTLLKYQILPIVNENDSVATKSLRVGDNDRLAARVGQMVEADMIILLSDVNGLYTENPNTNPHAKHVPVVKEITPKIEAMAGAAGTNVGTGGMVTKIAAAKIANACGSHTIIMHGEAPHPIMRLMEGEKHTIFEADEHPHSAYKKWIAFSLQPAGYIIVDQGAENALRRGNSLLPAGVVGAGGEFIRGDAVSIRNQNEQEIAKGLITYNADETLRIMGHHSSEIEAVLGYMGRDVLVHRDDMALLIDT